MLKDCDSFVIDCFKKRDEKKYTRRKELKKNFRGSISVPIFFLEGNDSSFSRVLHLYARSLSITTIIF